MDRREAATVAERILAEFRDVPYDALVARLLGAIEVREVTGGSGIDYQVEIQGFWDTGRPGDLRVLVGVDDGSFGGAFSTVDRAFIVAPDGSFIGE
jgi:hypothetical protein